MTTLQEAAQRAHKASGHYFKFERGEYAQAPGEPAKFYPASGLDYCGGLTLDQRRELDSMIRAYLDKAAELRDNPPPAIASEPQAEPLMINGLTEAETSACASVAGLVGQPGAVGLSEREAFDAFVRLERPSLLSGARTYNDENQVLLHLMDAAWSAWQARAALATQPVAPGWIPVTESLPAEDEPVLIAAWAWGYADGTRIYGVATRRGETWFNPQDAEALGEWWPATHWMPIPPPPAATQGAKT